MDRQARCGVSYRDPLFDYEADLAFCRRLRSSVAYSSKKKAKNNATNSNRTVKPTLISKEGGNAKERAEAVQLQRAIDESLLSTAPKAALHLHNSSHEDLPDTSANSTTSFFNNEKDNIEKDLMSSLFDLKKVSVDGAVDTCVAFQCLLDVASEAVLEGDVHVYKLQDTEGGSVEVQGSTNQVLMFSMERPHNAGTEKEVKGNEVNMNYSECKEDSQVEVKVSHVDTKGSDTEQATTEDESSNLSDDSGCKKTKPMKVEEEGRRKNTPNVVSSGRIKEARSGRLALIAKVKTSSVASSRTYLSLSNACAGKENISTCPPIEFTQSRDCQNVYFKRRIAVEDGTLLRSCQSGQNSFGPWKVDKSQVLSSVSPSKEGVMGFSAPSPTVFHRRVIGLSRRFRPPPLHPYLSRQDR